MDTSRADHTVSPALIGQAAAGDEAAFAVISDRMTALIGALVRQFCQDGLEEDDLRQECLVALLTAVRTYRADGGAAFTTYATTCMHNRLISVARRYSRRMTVEQPLGDGQEPSDPDDTDPARQLMEQEDLVRWQSQLRDRLSPLEYAVLAARLSDCSYEETAAQLGISKKTVDNAVQRLRRKLSPEN